MCVCVCMCVCMCVCIAVQRAHIGEPHSRTGLGWFSVSFSLRPLSLNSATNQPAEEVLSKITPPFNGTLTWRCSMTRHQSIAQLVCTATLHGCAHRPLCTSLSTQPPHEGQPSRSARAASAPAPPIDYTATLCGSAAGLSTILTEALIPYIYISICLYI